MVKYDFTTRVTHWVSAFVILWATFSGLYAASLPLGSETKEFISFFNVSITTLFIPFFLFRVFYNVFFKKINHHHFKKTKNYKIAQYTHALIYSVVLVILITGILMLNHSVSIFNWFHFPRVIHDTSTNHFFEIVHKHSCQVLFVLFSLHILAVIKHEISGVRLFKRMW